MQFKCEECEKWIDAEEYAYGHDCEPEEKDDFEEAFYGTKQS